MLCKAEIIKIRELEKLDLRCHISDIMEVTDATWENIQSKIL